MAASYDLNENSRIYKIRKRQRDLSCTYCPPHRKENGHWVKPRKKKAWQLDPNRHFKRIKIASII